ncbi:alpha-N-arabinofuranosidase [Brevundimonas sp.]|uniref:alpha-N-arabinofuranosidase n=1 Tax=Brevundimonas sp. TaxID=1871086 RepID=UPI002BD6D08A|nr:alpha-L-arabinofuranosidase C-terminal domain-containing protein [Brevundimonas sp.]HWQ85439.1 alpha-L-arabinofuranosidase C-terminal domain-containing protein [Brevundimonas sp.]
MSRETGFLAGLVLAAAVAFASTVATAEPRATATLRMDQPGAVIAPEVYGQFMEQLGAGIDGGVWVGPASAIPNTRGFRNDVLQALKALDVPVVRWPGGCYADIYHWRDGIGPRDRRPVTLNRWWGDKEENNAFGTHEFFEFAELIEARTYLSVNVGSGTPTEAADWVEYITSPSRSRMAELRRANGRDRPWKIDYLGVGNEPWGCGGRMRASWYADLFRQYVGFIAPGDRRTTIVAAGPNAEDVEWTRTLMSVAAGDLDALSLHYYTLPTGDWAAKGPATGFDESQWRSAFVQTYRMEAMIAAHDAVMDEADPEGKKILAVDEWGAWYDPTPGSPGGWLQQQNSLRDALLAAVNFNIFHRHADRVRLGNIAQMVNVLQAMILTDGPRMVLTPTYHAFEMYRPFQGATVLPLTIQSPDYGPLKAVDGTAALGLDGKIHVALVNLDPEKPVEVALSVSGGTPRRVSGRILTAEVMDAHNVFDAPRAVEPAPFTDARLRNGSLSVSLPAKSLVVLVLE